MTRNLKRYYGTGHLHFITCSCYQRRAYLRTPEARDLFLFQLERMRKKYRFIVVGYVVMPEHFHLMVSEPQTGTPSTAMQAIKLGFTRRVLENGINGIDLNTHHVWQPRFYDFNVWNDPKRIEKLRYMHRNPVTRGLVDEPGQWPWSSFRSYMFGEPGLVKINDWELWKITASVA
ncbi:MAG TPA: transposase [Terriglobales bacterium]|nr:transposase [Terriglobales bacterium]